jgi:hypothetical protein
MSRKLNRRERKRLEIEARRKSQMATPMAKPSPENAPDPDMLETGPAAPAEKVVAELVQPEFNLPPGEDGEPSAFSRLKEREASFVEAYIRHGNATEAVVESGITANRKSAAVIASRLLRNVNVKAAIAEISRAIHSVDHISFEKLITSLAGPALGDPGDLQDENGKWRDLKDMPKLARLAIKEMSYHPNGQVKNVRWHERTTPTLLLFRLLNLVPSGALPAMSGPGGGLGAGNLLGQGSQGRAPGSEQPGAAGTPDEMRQLLALAIGARMGEKWKEENALQPTPNPPESSQTPLI